VQVRLVLAGKSDHPIVTRLSRTFYSRLLDWRVRIYEWHQGVLHAKTAVVDGIWGTVGSFNLELSSFRMNPELKVVFADPRIGAELQRSFDAECALCSRIDPSAWARRPWWQKALELLCLLLRRLV
jgi:cardiolipin synthase A/B